MTIATKMLAAIAGALHSPKLLPEAFYVDGKRYEIAYERDDNDAYLRFIAYDGAIEVTRLEMRTSTTNAVLEKLITLIEESERHFESSATWQLKYSVIFRNFNYTILPLLNTQHITFRWVDPDLGYEQDVSAYMQALKELKSDLQKLIE